MKLRYQLRGLGIGIMVTALLMGVSTGKGIPLSDAEIKAKALELGMVERDALKLTDVADGSSVASNEGGEMPEANGSNVADTDLDDPLGTENFESEEPDSGSESDESEEPGSGSESDASEESGDISESDASGEVDAVSEPDDSVEAAFSGNAEGDEGNPAGDVVRIVIEYGVNSNQVSRMLEEAGLVEDAAAFDRYLCDNGLSRSVTAGTYEIFPGTSEEEIIRIITKNR